MGRRGPKPEPASVKLAKGNSGHRPIGVDPVEAPVQVESEKVQPVTSVVSPPVWLKRDGLAVWKRLAPRLISLKLLGQTDVDTFGRYCRNFARWLKMQKRLDAMGEIYEIETASGVVRRADPSFLISDRIERQLLSAEAVFGLNPAERQRIFAARAAAGMNGDLFGNQPGPTPAPKQPATPAQEPEHDRSAIGFLN